MDHPKRLKRPAILLAFFMSPAWSAPCAAPATDSGVFTTCIENSSQNASLNRSSDTAEAFFNQFTNQSLTTFFPGYNGADGLTALTNFNSLPVALSFASNSAALTVNIDAIGYNKTFTGTIVNGDVGQARNDARDAFVQDIKDSNLLAQIWKYQAEHSPNHPITGSNGLLQNSTAQSFNDGFTDIASKVDNGRSKSKDNANLAETLNTRSLGISFSTLRTRDLSGNAISVPLTYTMRSDLDPRSQTIVSLPLSRTRIDQQTSQFGGLGLARRIPIDDNWTVTPGLRYSVGGSKDLLIASQLISATLSNTWAFEGETLSWAFGNMIGYNRTLTFRGYNPDISETSLRNGVMLSQPVEVMGKNMALEYSLVDTRYFGSKIYLDNTQELGLTLGTNKSAVSSRSFLRGGLSFLRGRDTRGLTANIGYWF